MNESFDKENGTSVITQSIAESAVSPVRPLRSQSSLNSLNNTPKKLDNSPSRRLRKADSVSSSSSSSSTTAYTNLQIDYSKLERRYTDLLLKVNEITQDHTHLEADLSTKEAIIKEQQERITNYEAYVRSLQDDYDKNKELLTKEIQFYQELIETLQTKTKKLGSEVGEYKKRVKELESKQDDSAKNVSNDDLQDILEISEKFNRLLKDFKVLQSNFELERNSKLVLIDQIEYLTKENNILLSNQSSSKVSMENEHDELEDIINNSDHSVIHNIHNTVHTMNELTDEDDSMNDPQVDIETDLNDSEVLNFLADDSQINHSSPIKHQYGHDESLEVSNGFQFPPPEPTKHDGRFPSSPDPQFKDKKRQSLPVKTRPSPQLENEEFVLSPLKLASNTSHQYFDLETPKTIIPNTTHRYSNSKPNHSRYNSHDIVPIKVEFESLDPSNRSASVPEKEHQKKRCEIIDESPEVSKRSAKSSVRNSAFYALNGYDGDPTSNRNSMTTATSSKRSSVIMDAPQDLSRQEMMKLKFELQSLKLHNEKLLSYIGFELQKQKNNIKKLSSKQSARTLRALSHVSKQIEYSDAKLIESSRDMLIHKKRVLRSVSINPILSKNYKNNSKGGNNHLGIMPKGFLPFANQLIETFENDEDFIDMIDKKPDNSEDDDYGFMKHNDKFSKRIFSTGLQAYLNYDELDETEACNDDTYDTDSEKNIKKYKSQSFAMRKVLMSSDEEEEEEEEEDDDVEMKTRDSTFDSDGSVISSDEEMGMLTQIKYLIMGSSAIQSNKPKKRRDQQQLVDDGLKLKFLTITLGIMIIGLRFSHKPHSQ